MFDILDSATDLENQFKGNDSKVSKEPISFETKDDDFGKEFEEEEEILDDFENEFKTDRETIEPEPEERYTKRDLLSAKIQIGMFDMLVSVGARALSGDFETRKFNLSKQDKEEMAEMMAEANFLDKKKVEPSKQITKMLIAHAAMILVPLLIAKGMDYMKKRKAKKEAAKNPQPNQKPKQEETTYTSQVKNESVFESEVEDAVIISEEKRIESKRSDKPKGENRGRTKGMKKNPSTGKMEKPIKTENGVWFYSWGAQQKVRK